MTTKVEVYVHRQAHICANKHILHSHTYTHKHTQANIQYTHAHYSLLFTSPQQLFLNAMCEVTLQ